MISHLLKERMRNCWDDLSKNLANLKKHFDLRSRAFEACSFSAESIPSVPRVALFGNIEVDYRKKFVWKLRLIGSIPPTARSFDLLLSVCQWTVLSLVAELTGILAGYLLKKADRPHVEWLL